MIWPHAGTDWRRGLEWAEAAFAALAIAILRFTRLLLACHDDSTRRRALEHLAAHGADAGRITTVVVPSDDTWARDVGPVTVFENGRPVGLEPNFNGWGGKYRHAHDAAFARTLLDTPPFAEVGRERAGLVIEGGAIELDGLGSALINRRTLIDPARNPGMDATAVEAALRRDFGLECVLWLDVPQVPGDDTDGHVDTLVRFTPGGSPVLAAPHSPDDPAAPMLARLREQLEALHDQDRIAEPVELPGPEPFIRPGGTPCPATYANFLVVNDGVLVPAYADANDGVAAERLRSCFPGRTIVPVPARTFVQQAGSVHCLTMQLPAGTLSAPANT